MVNMDEVRMKLSTRFMKSIVSKMLSKMIYKKLGYKVNVQIHDIDIWMIDGDTSVKANVELKMNTSEFTKLMKSFDN